MVSRFDGGPRHSSEWNSHRYFRRDLSAYVSPCKRCGVPGYAEACRECRRDPAWADAMPARAWQRHCAAEARAQAMEGWIEYEETQPLEPTLEDLQDEAS